MATRGGKRKPAGGAPALERARDALHEVPPRAFTKARTDEAKRLADAGYAAEAAALKKERRRPPSVWVINALARTQPEVVKGLLEAGGELKRAQRKALSGVGGEELRDATTRMRDAVRNALPRLKRLLAEAGESSSATVMERARQTLLTAAQGTDHLREALRAGRLDADLSPAGFGDVAGLRLVSPPPAATVAPVRPVESDVAEQRERRAALKRAAEIAHRERERRRHDLARAEAERNRLEKVVQAAEARARQAREKADSAARNLETAKAGEAEARRNAEAADAAVKG